MAEKNYKLKKGQWTDQVINFGVDKTIPLGTVTVVYNADGSEAGFIKSGVFYNPGEKVQAQPKATAAAATKSDPLAKYNLPPAVDISGIKKMTPEEIQSHITEAQKRADAATKLYQDTPSSDTNYAYIKQANDSAINQLNALKDAAGSKTKASAATSIPAFDPNTALKTAPPAKYTGWIVYDGGDGKTYGSYLKNGEYVSDKNASVQTDPKTKNWVNITTGAVVFKAEASQAQPTGNTPTNASTEELQNQLNLAVTRRSDASNNMDMYSTDSPEYKQAKADFDKYTKEANDIQAKIKESRSGQQAAVKPEVAKIATDKVAAAQKALNEATQKAKDKNADPTKDPSVQQAQKNLETAKAAATKAGTDTSSGANAGTQTKPASVIPNGATVKGNNVVDSKGNVIGTTTDGGKTYTPSTPTTPKTTTPPQTTPNANPNATTSGSGTPTYSKTAPRSAVGVDASGNWVDAKGRIVGTSVAPAISMMPKGAVGIEGGNWVDAKGNKLGSATPVNAAGATANQTAYEQFRQKYGSEAAIIDANPELKAAFNQALSAPGAALSTAQWQALYENSSYFKNSYSSYVSAEDARLARPGEYVNQYNKALSDIKQYAAEAGISLDWSSPELQPIANTPGAQTTNPLANKQFDPTKPGLIDDILHKYWDTGANKQAITQYLATKGKIDPTIAGGQAQTDEQALRSYAADLGLSNYSLPSMTGGDYFTNAATQIAQGGLVNGTPTDLNYWKQDLKNKAKAVYGGKYDTQLDAGQTIKSLAAPYINTLTSLLESSPDTIDLSNPNGDGALIRNAMQKNTTPEDFAKQVMSDPRWLTTKNAKSSLMGIGNQFLSAFGLSALG